MAEVRAKGLSVRPHVFLDSVTRALKCTADDVRADLAVVGARGRLVPDAFVGSTAERIAAATDRPVLLVRRDVSRPYRHLVVAIDPSSDLRRLLAAARLVAPSAERSVLHVYEDPYENAMLLHGATHANMRARRTQVRREARAALTRAVTDAGLEPHEVLLRNGNARRVLELEDRERSASDTVFVIERDRSVVGHLMFGSLSRWLISRGECDVLLV
jgi:universal stress protein E